MKKTSRYLFRRILAMMSAVLFVCSGCSAQTASEHEPDISNSTSSVESAEDNFPSGQKDNDEVVPNVAGKWVGEACDILDDCGVQYEITYEYVENVEANRVISQTPSEGSPIETGMTVKLIISGDKKPESKSESKPESKVESKVESKTESKTPSQAPADTTQKMPNIVGMDVTAATQTLDSMGIYYTGNYQFNDTVPKGQVITQNPAAGTDAPKGTRATFIISDGKQPEQQVVTYEVTEAQPQQDNTPVQEPQQGNAEPDMSGVQKFLGSWYSFRPTANIRKLDNGKYLIVVRWSSSATSGVMWSLQADYDPYSDTLSYTDGLEIPSYYDTKKGEWVGIGPRIFDLSGYFQMNSNGEMLWYDDGVDGSSDIVFKKYNN